MVGTNSEILAQSFSEEYRKSLCNSVNTQWFSV
jgi:hypothetical protein